MSNKVYKFPSQEDGFGSFPVEFCGHSAILIVPKIDAKWTKDTLCFRSAVLSPKGEILSSGWPKFFNLGEKPDLYPDPSKAKDWSVELKVDGTLVICDYVNEMFSMRTRGTASYVTQANAQDFEVLPEQYPLLVEWLKANPQYSVLLELVTPNNVIVIRSDDVQFTLLGVVDKTDGTVGSLALRREIAQHTGLPLPEVFGFDSLEDCVDCVKAWKGKEGVVVAYNKNQSRVKVKGDWYLQLHRIKSELSSENNLIEFYVSAGMPDYQDFYNLIETTFDFEIASQLRGQISKLSDAAKEVKRIIEHMKDFVDSIRNFPTRRDQAQAILEAYGQTNRSSFVFALLDGKPLTNDQIIKLFWQVLKK